MHTELQVDEVKKAVGRPPFLFSMSPVKSCTGHVALNRCLLPRSKGPMRGGSND
jgi:hypothetical protein